MAEQDLMQSVKNKANEWLASCYDSKTREEVQKMLDNSDSTELVDAFYKDLEFGTGGLRGIMGAGSNRMNKYTVGAATQGLSNYLKKMFPTLPQISVVIGYDCRNNSHFFAETAAGIFSANGIKTYLFEDLRPTPEVSYAIRELGCQSGIILTASHNPKEYNGYKAYWDDGAQLTIPHDVDVIAEVNAIQSIEDIHFAPNPALIVSLGEEMDNKYLEQVKSLCLSPDAIKRNHDIKIVYTPIHGTGVKLIPASLRNFGFTQVFHVPEQDVVSGDFPTVKSPNPEEPAAMALAVKKGEEVGAELVMASDPDGDRLGIAIRDDQGKFFLMNGNQTALILSYYLITAWKNAGKITGKEFYVKTIVSSELMKDIAVKNGVYCFDCYTGFKWIAKIIREQEGKMKYICGGEESYGFLPADFVRDKDAVSSCSVVAEIAAWAKDQGRTLFDLLLDIYMEFGFSREKMIYIVRKGKTGAEEIEQMMADFRKNTPKELAGSKVCLMKDYLSLKTTNLMDGSSVDLDMPETSNVIQLFTEDGSKVSIRPSGTEPKIKFYFEVRGTMEGKLDYEGATARADEKIARIAKDLGI